MKTFLLSLSALLLFSFSFQKQSKVQISNDQNNNSLKLTCPDPLTFVESGKYKNKNSEKKSGRENIDQDWYGEAMENIEKDEYNISYSKVLDAYQSPNRKNNIRFIYHKDGFTAVTRDASLETSNVKRETVDEWSLQLQVTSYELRKDNSLTSITNSTYSTDFSQSEFKVKDNTASIEDDNLRIEYINNSDGMRQDFIIKQKPAGICPFGKGEGKLRLNLSADTKLKMIVGADALMFKDEDGNDKMKYSALKVYDSNGKELRAYFEKSNIKNENVKTQIKNQKSVIVNQKKSQIQNPNSQIEANLNSKIQNQKLFSIVVNDNDAVYPITIDPLSTTPSWTGESNQGNAQFGFSVSTAGDVNGDGYSDIIVGAPYFDNGVTDAGKTFVYLGSATGISATVNWTSEGNLGSLNTGYSVSTAGDVNDDGYSDVIIGTNSVSSWNTQVSGTLENLQDVYFTSPSKGCAVGANGAVVITINGGLNWTVESSHTTADLRSNWFTTPDTGYAVGLGGQIRFTPNGGTFWSALPSVTGANLSCVYFRTKNEGWAAGATGTILKTINSGFNWTAKTSGVTNELRDIIFTSATTGYIVGANGRILKTTNSGTNWVAQTSGTTQTLRGVYFSSSTDGLAFGHAGTILKTTDGGTTWNPQTSGTTQDLYGCSFTSSLVGWTVGFGSTVLKTTDGGSSWTTQSTGVNGDLRSVFFSSNSSGCVVGSGGIVYGYNSSSNGLGSIANVYNGSASGLSASPNSILLSALTIGAQNNIVSTAGDINGDGYSDVMVAYPISDSGKGTVFVYHGSASGSQTTPNTTLSGTQTNALYGNSISTAGDVDDDGYSDIIIGSPYFDNGQTDEGGVFVYRGSASGIVTTPYWTNEGNKIFSEYGSSVSTAGDVNGDGYSDIIIGAPFAVNLGKAFLYLGDASVISSIASWTYSGIVGEDLGSSVSTAGDVNADGYSDVIIGSPSYDNGQTDEGRALIFTGSDSGLSVTPNWTTEGNQTSANFGNCVSTAGDINGDGFSDVIVGAKLYNNGQTDEGKAFVYDGSASGIAKQLNLTMLIEGFYNSSTNTMVQDTVRLYLRKFSAPYLIIDSAKAFVSSTGTAAFSIFNAASGYNYYLEINHRNSLETWSSTPQSFTFNTMNYDFTNAVTKAYGDNMIQADASPVKFALYSGDENQDGTIDVTDVVDIYNDIIAGNSGYIKTDLTGDDFTDVTDLIIAYNNAINVVGVITP